MHLSFALGTQEVEVHTTDSPVRRKEVLFFLQLSSGGADADGWFDTGDIATIDEWGYMQIRDRQDRMPSGPGQPCALLCMSAGAMTLHFLMQI